MSNPIPYIPAIDPSVGENLAKLAEAVGNGIRPQLAFDTALRDALAAHPELIQKIGDLHARSPEAVRRLYGSHAADFFSKVARSPEDAASAARGTLQATTDTATNAAIANMSPQQRATLTQAGAERVLSGGQSALQVEQEARNTRTLNAFNTFLQNNRTSTPQEIVDQVRNRDKNITPDIAEGAFQSPLYAHLLQSAEDDDRLKLQERLAAARDARGVQQSRDQTIEMLARQLMLKSNSSNLDAWKEIVQNGENSADVLRARAKEADKRNPDEQALVDAADNFQRMNQQDRLAATLPILNQIRQNVNSVQSTLASRQLNSEEKSNQLSAITTSLNTGFSTAGLPIRAHFTPYVDRIGPFNQAPAITYTVIGADGKESPATDEQVSQVLNRTETGAATPEQSTQDPIVTNAINAIRNHQATLADVETATKYTPAQKAAIRAAFATGR